MKGITERSLILILLALVAVAFLPSLENGFVYDDAMQFTLNPHYRGLGLSHIRWAFTTFHAGHYQPLTWVSHSLVYRLWGMEPSGYHLVNLALHMLNAVLAYLLIRALLTRSVALSDSRSSLRLQLCSVAGAILFAVHPLRVESVAWATERRDVLSGFFYLLTLLAYLRLNRQGETRKKAWFIIAISLFLCSLLSKAWGITLPALLLVLDVYPLKRLKGASFRSGEFTRLLLEKTPFFLLSGIFALLAFLAQKKWGMGMVKDHDLLDRTMQSLYGLSFYLGKSLVPLDLSPLYLLRPDFSPTDPTYLFTASLVAGITLLLVAGRRKRPWALASWLSYAIILSPVLGYAQSGEQIVADRYTYLAVLPFSALASGGLFTLWDETHGTRTLPFIRRSAAALAVLAIATLSFLTFRQTKVWKDDGVLWERAIRHDGLNYTAYHNRGYFRDLNGDLGGALEDYDKAIELKPDYADAYLNRGYLHRTEGSYDKALSDYNATVRFDPERSDAYNNRAKVRFLLGDIEGAIADYSEAIETSPGSPIPLYNRGELLRSLGRTEAALRDFQDAIALDPGFSAAYYGRGLIRSSRGDLRGAESDMSRALGEAPINWILREDAERALGAMQAR